MQARAYNWNGGRRWGGGTGEAITGIRPMDILGSAITAPAMAIHTTGVAITATATVGTIRTTEIGDITLTSTDTGRP